MFAGACTLAVLRDSAAGPGRSRRQRREARGHVHDRAAGEVEHAPLPQEALRMPRPMRQRAVDEDAEQADEHQIGREAHALGKRAGDQRRRDDGELQLKHREEDERDRRRQIGMRRAADASEHEVGPRVADEAVEAVAEAEAEADDDPEQRDHAQRDEALKHRRDDVLGAHHAGVEDTRARASSAAPAPSRSAATPYRQR